jgi:hypothetical protein
MKSILILILSAASVIAVPAGLYKLSPFMPLLFLPLVLTSLLVFFLPGDYLGLNGALTFF